jgi:outer membrane usher protein
MFQTAIASTIPATRSSPLVEALYSVRVNGELVSPGSVLLTDAIGRFYVRTDESSQWRFPAPPSNEIIFFKGVAYVSLASYSGLIVKVDVARQEVDITCPVDTFTTSRLQVQPSESAPVTDAQSAYFLNYAFHAAAGAATQSSVNGLFDLGLSERSGGSLSASAFASDLPNLAHIVRLDTTWEIDDPDKHQSIHIGDFFTQPRSLGIPVRFAGVSFGTDFSTDPQFITFPTPSIDGSAALPSTVDVFLNNYQASSNSVPAGPYDIGSIPAVNGMNQAQVIVRDITGSEHVVSLSYYSSSALLKPGLSDYDVQAGAERLNYGVSSASYGPSFFSGTWRQGITDHLTAESHLESMGAARDFGEDLTTLLNDSGTLSVGLQHSIAPGGGGNQTQVGYDYRGSVFNAFAQLQTADQNYWELGYAASTARPKRLLQSGVGFELGRNELSFTDIERSTWDGAIQRVSLVTLSRGLHDGSVSVSYAPPAFGRPGTVTANLLTTLGPSDTAIVSTGVQGGTVSKDLAFQSGLPANGIGTSFNFQEQTADVDSYFIQANRQTQSTDASLGLSDTDDRMSVAADLSGALVSIDGSASASRQVQGSYGIVSIPGYPGVGVLLNNQPVGTTDRHGDLVVNSLNPYTSSLITLDPDSLPISANIETAGIAVVPSRGGAVAIRFATQQAGGIRLTIVDQSGVPLPPGSVVKDAGSVTWPVADDGAAYLAGIDPGRQTLTALYGANRCQFTVAVPDDIADLPDLGTFVCRVR